MKESWSIALLSILKYLKIFNKCLESLEIPCKQEKFA